jgi:radical SAM protein with 4Fe4S-binding SPASM domain
MTDNDNPLCLAPFSNLLIDTDKKVLPCTAFDNRLDSFGNIKTEDLSEIVNNKSWEILREDMFNGEFHKGCTNCNQREKSTGWSLKSMYQNDNNGYPSAGWKDGKIRHLELSGSNVCNLACLHCNSTFSSEWAKDYIRLGYDWGVETTYGDPELLLKNLKRLDLTEVIRIEFKGGEPLLNPETLATLKYLKDKNLLSKINIFINTNGTLIDEDVLELLRDARFVQIIVSVDGPDKLNQYIRYGRDIIASFENIEHTIEKFNSLPNVKIIIACAVMVYNIFRLAEINDWWTTLGLKYPKVEKIKSFDLIVMTPEHLSIRILSDKIRQKLINYYENHPSNNIFKRVIQVLQDPRLDSSLKNSWVDFTNNMDRIRGNSLLEAEPLLSSEFIKE